jgi:hypothetical protein
MKKQTTQKNVAMKSEIFLNVFWDEVGGFLNRHLR